MHTSKQYVALIAVAAITALIQAFSVQPGFDWLGDDYASYIHNARFFTGGTPYAMPGYEPNLLVDSGPGAYPPGYPLLLAPAVAMFGTDLVALRIYNLLFAAACVFFFMLWLRPVASFAQTVAVGILLGLSPFVWLYKESLGSEFACYALLLLWLLLDRRFGEHRSLRNGLIAALPLGFAVLTRLSVAPAIVAGPIARLWHRRLSLADILAAGLAVIMVVAGLWFVTPHIVEHYLANITVNVGDQTAVAGSGLGKAAVVLENLRSLPGKISVIWSDGPLTNAASFAGLDLARKGLTLAILLAGFTGLALSIYRGPGTVEVYFVLQLAVLLVLPSKMTATRLYAVLSLLLIYYCFVLAARARTRWLRPSAVFALLVAACIPSWIGIAATPPDRFARFDPKVQTFLEWVRTSTPPDAVILTHKARALALYTGRSGVEWHQAHADREFQDWAQQRHAEYIVFYIDQADVRRLDARRGGDDSDASLNRSLDMLLADFYGTDANKFQQVFANERFRAFKLPPR